MLHIQTTTKDVNTLVLDLTAAVERHKFGVLHIHDLQRTMRNKGIKFPQACRILEIIDRIVDRIRFLPIPGTKKPPITSG